MSSAKSRSNSKSHKIISVSWIEYLDLIQQLTKKLKKARIKIDAIYGVPRGGYIPAVILSHNFNKPIIHNVFKFNIDNVFKRILIIDDICDTGSTIETYKNFLSDQMISATIFKHKLSKITPDFYMKENTNWIKFPYEKE